MSTQIMSECRDCHGQGFTVFPSMGEKFDIPCDRCNQTGSVDLVAEIKQRHAAATPGPYIKEWDSCECGDGYGCSHGSWIHAIRLPVHTVEYEDTVCDRSTPADSHRHEASEFSQLTPETASMLAHSWEDIRVLLEVLESKERSES